MQITLKDVAKKAGVSTATVSRVLSGTAVVSPMTRQVVERVIRSSGYQKNEHAVALGRMPQRNRKEDASIDTGLRNRR